ncbi:kelch domain-containing protein 3-like [Amblyomma americanum]
MWTARVEGGPCCTNHAAVAVNDEIYLFGGYCVDEVNTMRRPMDVHVLNTASLRWTQIPVQRNLESVPFQRSGHTVVAYGEYAYLWGGRNEDGACNILYRFDTASVTWLRPRTLGETPAAREGHSACVVGSRMYVFGGVEEDDVRLSQDVHVLDLDTMKWHLLVTRGASPEWRSFHSAVAIGHCIYVWGGRRGSDAAPAHLPDDFAYSDRLAYLDTAKGVWVHPVTRGSTPLARCSHSSFVHNGEMYVFGGYNGLLATFFGDMHKYNPERSQWSQVKLLRKGPCPRRGHCCSMVGDRMFLFGGTSQQNILDRSREASDNGSLEDHPDLHVLEFAPSLRTLCLLVMIDFRLDISKLPEENRQVTLSDQSNIDICCVVNLTPLCFI